MEMFDSMQDKHHTCGVDNLYISAKFCKDAYQHPKCILLYGVACTHGRGLPLFVMQVEVKKQDRAPKGGEYE